MLPNTNDINSACSAKLGNHFSSYRVTQHYKKNYACHMQNLKIMAYTQITIYLYCPAADWRVQ
jgi:hypothetical protein